MFILIDHDDSFIYNLKSYVEISGHKCPTVAYKDWVARHRAMSPCTALDALLATVKAPDEPLDGLILSPGPGHPSEYALSLALCQEIVGRIPLLGVCLGHQLMALAAGAQVIAAPRPMHGKISALPHDGQGLFAHLPSPLAITRYHSLIVDDATLPAAYHPTASLCESGTPVLMAMTHASNLAFGLQFHPEALWTEQGQALVSNFCRIAVGENVNCGESTNLGDSAESKIFLSTGESAGDSPLYYGIQAIQLPCSLTELLDLYSEEDCYTCLNSSRVDEANHWSLLGLKPLENLQLREVTTVASLAFIEKVEDLLQREKKALSLPPKDGRQLKTYDMEGGEKPPLADGGLFFLGGYEFLLRQQWPEGTSYDGQDSKTDGHCDQGLYDGPASGPEDMPQAMAAVYSLVLMENHLDGKTYVLVQGHSEEEVLGLQDEFLKELDDKLSSNSQGNSKMCDAFTKEEFCYRYPIDEAAYSEKIKRLIAHMYDGDSYVANLTQTVEIVSPVDPLAVFHMLSAANPSPYGSINKCGQAYMVSASVELFASVKDGEFCTKPIKGTRPRGATDEEDRRMFEELSQSEKDRSELMMVTDMERNDCNQFAVPGSVAASADFAVETYATVHQLVSTVRARIPDELPRPLATWRALLKMAPGGSISGAPKHRSINILRELEEGPRRLYTGIQGYVSFAGDAHLSILIRTAVKEGSRWTLGVGGGITVDSEPHFEYEELKQKAKALLRALDPMQ